MDPSDLPKNVARVRALLEPLRRYHRYSVEGLEHIPRSGGALLALHHSLASYDGFLLCLAIYEQTGRLATALGDDLIFRLPGLGELARSIGIHAASPAIGRRLLAEGQLLVVAPGGMREALRPSGDRYTAHWDDRQGFARLALRAGVPLIVGACPAADDIFTVYKSGLTQAAYRYLKVPLPVFRGLGLSVLPRPVRLVHYLAPPITPPQLAADDALIEEQVQALHDEAVAALQGLLRRHGDPG